MAVKVTTNARLSAYSTPCAGSAPPSPRPPHPAHPSAAFSWSLPPCSWMRFCRQTHVQAGTRQQQKQQQEEYRSDSSSGGGKRHTACGAYMPI